MDQKISDSSLPSKAPRLALACVTAVLLGTGVAQAADDQKGTSDLGQAAISELPLPPPVEDPPKVFQTFTAARAAHVALVRREAAKQGLPPDLADAVAYVESSYNPEAVGAVGEVGLMQIRPETAAMLGYKGDTASLLQPEINVRYSVTYLVGAWRKTDGDVCRTLMKYRAGHGEERMSALSAEYCRRAKGYLASIGSPLAQGAAPSVIITAGVRGQDAPKNLGRSPQAQAREQDNLRKLKGAEYWAAHERRVAIIAASLRQRGIIQ
jgi:hypothetical protein